MPKKPPVPSKTRRPPVSKTTGLPAAPPSTRSYQTLPSLTKWQADTMAGRSARPGEIRAFDPILRTIDALVYGLQAAEGGAHLYLLGRLFFATMYWLNNYTMDAECRKPILSLNLFAGNDLARLLECPLNGLASKLQELYGVEMTPDGVDKDRGLEESYFDAAKRETYRVFFFSGRAFHYRTTSKKFVVLHTNTDAMGALMGVREGHGFVLSMSNRLYVGLLETLGLKHHSYFMGGRPVQCAGTMQFNRGVVTYVRNDSGHYQPVDPSMVKVLQLLRMNGVDLRRLTVGQEKKFQRDRSTDMAVRGDIFMRNNGNWNAILARADHQPPL